MNKIFTIIQHDDITEVKYSSPPGLQDLLDATFEHANSEVKQKRLWDMSCGYNVSIEDLQQIAQAGRKIDMPEHSKVAIVAPDDLSFGLTRVYSVHRKDPRSKHQVFRNREDALNWLNQPFDEIEGLT